MIILTAEAVFDLSRGGRHQQGLRGDMGQQGEGEKAEKPHSAEVCELKEPRKSMQTLYRAR